MQVEIYAVYEITDEASSNRDEIKRFKSRDKAKAYAETYARRHHVSTSIDWVLWEITRNGREVIDSDADLYTFDGDAA